MTMEIGKDFKARLRGDVPLFGPWVSIPDPSAFELMARLAFDFLLVDGEHSPIHPHSLAALLPSADLYRKPVIYRPRRNDPSEIKTALDAGAAGVMVPMIDDANQARAVVETCNYPPIGQRGIGPWRASGYYDDFDKYLLEANDATAVAVQIETARGLKNVDAIAAVEGVDILFAGPADLSASLGLSVGLLSKDLIAALARIAHAARASGKIAATDLVTADRLPQLRALGFSLFTIGSDMSFIQQSGSALIAELSKNDHDSSWKDDPI